MATNLLCVFLGCGLGGVCRYGLSLWLPKCAAPHFPWATFAANTLGCLLIGLLLGWLCRRPFPSQALTLLTVTGFCGGFTTFSTFSNELLQLLRGGSPWLAAAYAALSPACGLALTAFGWWAASR